MSLPAKQIPYFSFLPRNKLLFLINVRKTLFWVKKTETKFNSQEVYPNKKVSYRLFTKMLWNKFFSTKNWTYLNTEFHVTMALVMDTYSGSKSSSSPERRTSLSGSVRLFFLLNDRYLTLAFCNRLCSALSLRLCLDGLLYIKKLSVTQKINIWKICDEISCKQAWSHWQMTVTHEQTRI